MLHPSQVRDFPQAGAVRPTGSGTKTLHGLGLQPSFFPSNVEVEPTGLKRVAFFLLCVYIVSNLANDWALRLFGGRAYLSLVAGIALPLACLGTGSVLRGIGPSVGKWWLAFIAWAVLSIPFSSWPGGTVAVIREFLTKNALIYLYATASAITVRQCRTLFYVNAFGGLTVILASIVFGDASSGRLLIPDSIFFDNSNDLALQLLISASFLGFMLFSSRKLVKVVGAVLFAMALLYSFKTASRANLLSIAFCFVGAVFVSRQRMKLLALGVVLAIVAALLIPSSQWARMVYVVVDSGSDKSAEEMDRDGDLGSQVERTYLLKRSLMDTLENPIFGIGAGQFANNLWAESKTTGARALSLGTHNTYTQVSSEMGLPALMFYLLILFGSLNLNRVLYKKTAGVPEMRDVSNMAFCLFLGTLAYASSTFFHHVAYGRQLPTLSGMSAALWLAANEKLKRLQLDSRG
jgi:O-antigen ligase